MADNPNKITDASGGARNFNVESVFESFGYTPTQQEVDALAPAFEGRTNIEQTGRSAVSNYVIAHQQIQGTQSSIQGELLSEQEAEKMSQSLGKIYEEQGQEAYNKAADVYSQAPKLFGSMTPDQIDQYLAPVTQATQKQQGVIDSQSAARGLGGSSIEANAKAQEQGIYKQNVLSQGLGVGMNQQDQMAKILQSLGAQKYGASGQQYGLAGQYSGQAAQSAANMLPGANMMAGLGMNSANSAILQNAMQMALNPQQSKSAWSWGGPLLGSFVGSAMNPLNPVGGAGYGANMGGNLASTYTGDPRGAQTGQAINSFTGQTTASEEGHAKKFMDYYMSMYGGGGGMTSGLMGGGGGGGK